MYNADEANDIHPLIRARRSARVFDPDRPVPARLVELLIEAARWAPSSRNRQPWRFIVFDERTPEALAAARACLSEGNQAWANRAPLLILTVAEEITERGRANRKAQHDIGMATQNLLLQAVALGLNCRPMGGFDVGQARESFSIPNGFTPVVMIALGYPGSVDDLRQDVREKETAARQRRPIEHVAFRGGWEGRFAG